MATREMTRPPGLPVLEQFFKPWNNWYERTRFNNIMTVPPVNIIKNENNYNLSLCVPGLKKEDLKISLEGSIICISSQKEEIEERLTWKEFDLYSFSRSFTLPDDVDADHIEARCEGGLLRIVLPRREQVKQTTVITQVAVH